MSRESGELLQGVYRFFLWSIGGEFRGKVGRAAGPQAHVGVHSSMAKTNPLSQKIEVRGQGVSGFSQADLDQRAKELALIDNRSDTTDDDRARALAEFRDRTLPDAVNEDADSMQSLSRDPSDPLVDRGHQVPEYGNEDEKAALEKMALEGVEEAQHEQMVESRNLVDEPLRSRPKRKL